MSSAPRHKRHITWAGWRASCRTRKRLRRRGRTSARARRPRLRQANSFAKKSIKSATASMEPDRRSRRSPSASPRRDAQVLPFARPGKAGPRRAPERAPNMLLKQASTSARPIADHAFRAPCREFSSTSREALHRTRPFRVMQSAPRHGAPRPSVLPRHARQCARRVLRVAQQRHVRQLAPGRAIKHSLIAGQLGSKSDHSTARRAQEHFQQPGWRSQSASRACLLVQ